MTRLLGMADLHVGATHLTSLEEQLDALIQVEQLARQEHVDAVVIAGDATHFAHPTTRALEVLGRFFHLLDEDGIPVVVVEGNHDRGVPGVAEHFRGHVHVAARPRIVQLDGVDVACLPYLPDSLVRAQAGAAATREEIAHRLTGSASDILAGFLAQRRPGIPLVFAGHGTVAGSETSTGFQMGFLPGTAWVLGRAQLRAFDAALVGHIHKAAEDGGILIPGSLLPLDFSETEPKGVWLIDLHPVHAAPRFAAILSPRVETYELRSREAITNFLSYTPALPHARVRVRVSCDEATAREYPPARIAQEAYAAGATLVQVDLDVQRGDRRRDEAMTDELQPDAAIERYLEGRTDLDAPLQLRVESLAEVTIANVESSGPRLGGDLSIVGLEATDFIGIREASLSLEGGDVYAITGPVGAGKSSLGSDVPRFALFGESRAGAKDRDRLIRLGADSATAAATLRGADGHVYRVVRKLKRAARGVVSSTLDVLERNGSDWHPLSDGKLASGQDVISRILGGLSDETLVTANLILQRESDRYTRAAREDRRRVLAEAAGLAIYDTLAEAARAIQRDAEKQLGELQAAAAPLAQRAAGIPGAESELAEERDRAESLDRVDMPARRAAAADARRDYERARDRYGRLDAARDRVASLHRDLVLIEGDVAGVEGKIARTRSGILDRRAELEGAAEQLTAVRAQIAALELRQVAEADEARAAAAALVEVGGLERDLATMRGTRKARIATLDAEIASIDRQERRLADAACPVIDQIRAKQLDACTFLADAQREVRGRAPLEAELATLSEGSAEEFALAERIDTFPLPDAPDTRATVQALIGIRLQATALEANAQWAAKIPEADAYVAQETAHLEELRARARAKREELEAARREEDAIRAEAADDGDTGSRLEAAERAVRELEQQILSTARAIARLEGRLEELRAAAAEAERLAIQIRDSAFDVAAAKELVIAWRACRVMVLETSVIPAIEETANEILRRFPYGLQLQFATQRDRKAGDGQAETLDIEVLGGHGPIYELCSGGQQTVIDFALHVAIALVVSRRAGSRLSYLYVDEPAFLDAPGYEAFAAVVRFIHETFHLTVLVASHVADLVDALGARQFVVEPGPDGSTVREEALA